MIPRNSIQDIVDYAEAMQIAASPTHTNLLDVYEGNVKEHIEIAMQSEFNSKAFENAKGRISPINILKRTTDKLAKVYSQGVERSTSNPSDQNLLSSYEKRFDMDNTMSKADSMVNLLRSISLEPYIRNGDPELRVMTPNEFTVWSDDKYDKTVPTVFIKYRGTRSVIEKTDNGEMTSNVNIYSLFDADEFLTVDARGQILTGKDHSLERIPFSYMNVSASRLVPLPDKDSYAMSTLIPLLLSDLNYASKYQSHGIRYAIDCDISNLDGNPDTFWQARSLDGDNTTPQIGVVSPTVDIDKVLTSAKEQLMLYLESRSLKVGSSGKFENNASGVAKIIDSADVTDVRKENMKLFRSLETDLWQLVKDKHNEWVDAGLLEGTDINRKFSPSFEVSIKYGDMAPVVDPDEKRKAIEFKLKNRLTTRERAIREANPELEESELLKLIEELKNEEPAKIESDIDSGDELQDNPEEES